MQTVDVLIVGAGPAGSSTALHLLQRDPAWAGRLLVLDKERHPRHKLCGGGLTEWGARPLAALGLDPPVPHVTVDIARFGFSGRMMSVRRPGVFRVFRRDEFDAWLCGCAKAGGAQVREGEEVIGLEPQAGGIRVTTPRAEYWAKVVVGADGSKSLVRRRLGLARPAARAAEPGGVARLLEVLTPEDPQATLEFTEGSALFDFTPLAMGVQGYYWDFPSLVQGRAFMNRGVYDSRAVPHAPRAALKPVLAEQMQRRGRALDSAALQGHPIRWFDPRAAFARPHCLLVGDAAGVDPLFGEGIGYALHYGRAAAREIDAAFSSEDYSFRAYRRRVLLDWVGRDLTLRALGAAVAYRLMLRPGWAERAASLLQAVVPLIPWANQPMPAAANLDTSALRR